MGGVAMNNKELKKYIDKFRNIPRTETYHNYNLEEKNTNSINKTKKFALNFFAIAAILSVSTFIILSNIKPPNPPMDTVIASNTSNLPMDTVVSSNNSANSLTNTVISSDTSSSSTDTIPPNDPSGLPTDSITSSNSSIKEFVIDDLSFSFVESIEQFNKNNNCNVEPIGNSKSNACENIMAKDRIVGIKITNSCIQTDNEYSLVAFCIINNEKLFLDNFIGPWEIIRYKEIEMRVCGKFLENGYHRYNIKFECNGITYFLEITSKNKTSITEQLQIFY